MHTRKPANSGMTNSQHLYALMLQCMMLTIVRPFHDSLSGLYGPLILHMLPAQAHRGHECTEGIAQLA
jgi:hypothetical protein